MGIKDWFKKNRKIIIISLIIFLFIGIKVTYDKVVPPSPQTVCERIKNYSSSEVISYVDKIYPDDGGFLGLFKDSNLKNKIKVLDIALKDKPSNTTNPKSTSINESLPASDKLDTIKIEQIKTSYSNGYEDINITVKNYSSKPINYIKINLYFKDKSGNIIKSDWTNDSSNILPNASQIITKTVKMGDWNSVSAEISETN